MEKILEIEQDIPLLLGAENCNLTLIRSHFNIEINTRGNKIIMHGESSEIAKLSNLFQDLKNHVKLNKSLLEDDLLTYIKINRKPTEVVNRLELDMPNKMDYHHIILHSDSGAVKAKNPGQLRLAQSVQKNDVVFSIGPAGTGKTYLAVAIAVAQLKLQLVRKIVLVRPIVQAGEDLGYLPGDFKMKVNPYLRPLLDALEEFLPRELMKKYLEQEIIEIAPLAYMRGRTLNHAFIILDEAQNTTNAQMKMFLTRLGRSSKAIITGDATQIDLPRNQISGLLFAERILQGIEGIDFVRFRKEDVVRHRLVQDIIQAYEKNKGSKESEEPAYI